MDFRWERLIFRPNQGIIAREMNYKPSSRFRAGQEWLVDAKTDLDLAGRLRSLQDKDSKRRRLFALQQSLEKLIKSSFPVFTHTLISFTPMISLEKILQGKDLLGDARYKDLGDELTNRFAVFTDLKDLAHNPAERIGLKSLVEKLVEYTQYIGVNEGVAESLSEGGKLLGSRDEGALLEHSRRAYAIATTRGKLVSSYVANRPPLSKRYTGEGLDYLREYLVPNYISIVILFVSYYSLLDFLSRYEQSARYPSNPRVPPSLLASLDDVEISINRFYRFVSRIYQMDEYTKVTDRGFFVKQVVRREETDLSPTAKKTLRVLSKGHVDFMLTGISVLLPYLHMLPYRLAHSVYVLPGGGRRASKLLNDAGVKSILNPKGTDEVSQALFSVGRDVVVIRETNGLTGRVENIATVERALVDLYFEASRHRTPFPLTEVGRILRNAIADGDINAIRLIKLSAVHHIGREMRAILAREGLVPPRNDDVINDRVRSVTAVSER